MSVATIARLKITLDDVKPAVLRRIEVPFDIRLDRKVPSHRVIPDDARGLIGIIDNWADSTFFMPMLALTIPDLLGAAGDPKLKANREKLIGMTTAKAIP